MAVPVHTNYGRLLIDNESFYFNDETATVFDYANGFLHADDALYRGYSLCVYLYMSDGYVSTLYNSDETSENFLVHTISTMEELSSQPEMIEFVMIDSDGAMDILDFYPSWYLLDGSDYIIPRDSHFVVSFNFNSAMGVTNLTILSDCDSETEPEITFINSISPIAIWNDLATRFYSTEVVRAYNNTRTISKAGFGVTQRYYKINQNPTQTYINNQAVRYCDLGEYVLDE